MAKDYNCEGSFFGSKTPETVFPNKVLFTTSSCFAEFVSNGTCINPYAYNKILVNQTFFSLNNKLIIKYSDKERHYNCKEKLDKQKQVNSVKNNYDLILEKDRNKNNQN